MARKIALHIEDNCIKLLAARGGKIESWATYHLDGGLVEQGMVQDTERVAQDIKELLKIQKVSEGKVRVALSGINSIFRIITLPELPAKLIPEAVSNEAARVLPVPLNEVYYAYQVIPAVQKGESRLFLAAYPRASTDALMETVRKAGLKVERMELAPLALARNINSARAMAVNAWLTYLDIVVLVDRIPIVIRSVSLPVDSENNAERLPAIREEIERTITFFNNSFPDSALDKTTPIQVCGDLALDEESMRYFGETGYPISLLLPEIQHEAAFDPSQQMVNLGMLIKDALPRGQGAQHSIIDINAIPAAYKPPPFNWVNVLVPVGLGIAAAGLYFGWLLVDEARWDASVAQENLSVVQLSNARLTAENKVLQAELATIQEQVTPLQTEAAVLEAKIKALNASTFYFNNTFDALGRGLARNNSGLAAVNATIPAGLLVTDTQVDGSGANLTGQASGEALVLEYARLLRSRAEIQSVNVLSLERMESGGEAGGLVAFEFRVEWSNP